MFSGQGAGHCCALLLVLHLGLGDAARLDGAALCGGRFPVPRALAVEYFSLLVFLSRKISEKKAQLMPHEIRLGTIYIDIPKRILKNRPAKYNIFVFSCLFSTIFLPFADLSVNPRIFR